MFKTLLDVDYVWFELNNGFDKFHAGEWDTPMMYPTISLGNFIFGG